MRFNPNISLWALAAISFWQIAATELWPMLGVIDVPEGWASVCTTMSSAFICSTLFYLITVQIPYCQKKRRFKSEITKRFKELEGELITVTGGILGEDLSLSIGSSTMNEKLNSLSFNGWDKKIGFPAAFSPNKQSAFEVLKSLCHKIRQVASENLIIYRDLFSADEIEALQTILDSKLYILLDNSDELIKENERIAVVNEIIDIYYHIHGIVNNCC